MSVKWNANLVANRRMSSSEVLTASGRLHASRSTGSGGTLTLENGNCSSVSALPKGAEGKANVAPGCDDGGAR